MERTCELECMNSVSGRGVYTLQTPGQVYIHPKQRTKKRGDQDNCLQIALEELQRQTNNTIVPLETKNFTRYERPSRISHMPDYEKEYIGSSPPSPAVQPAVYVHLRERDTPLSSPEKLYTPHDYIYCCGYRYLYAFDMKAPDLANINELSKPSILLSITHQKLAPVFSADIPQTSSSSSSISFTLHIQPPAC